MALANRLGSTAMNFKALDRGELLATIEGIRLGVSLFLSWHGLLILTGAVSRARESGARRKPPGVL